jgi:hypothetical protein
MQGQGSTGTKKRLPHNQWSAEKERALDRTRKIERRKKLRAKQDAQASKSVAEVYFKKWLLRKTNYEKAQSLLHQGIDASRAGRGESWKEVGTALAAVDVMLGTFDLSGRDGLENGQRGSEQLDKENTYVFFFSFCFSFCFCFLFFFPLRKCFGQTIVAFGFIFSPCCNVNSFLVTIFAVLHVLIFFLSNTHTLTLSSVYNTVFQLLLHVHQTIRLLDQHSQLSKRVSTTTKFVSC